MDRQPGRPKGRPYPIIKQVRLGESDAAALVTLADRWRCSEAAAIRRLLAEAVQRDQAE